MQKVKLSRVTHVMLRFIIVIFVKANIVVTINLKMKFRKRVCVIKNDIDSFILRNRRFFK